MSEEQRTSPAKDSSAGSRTTRKTSAQKRTAAKKTSAQKSAARKAPAQKTTSKTTSKTTAKKTPAKKTAQKATKKATQSSAPVALKSAATTSAGNAAEKPARSVAAKPAAAARNRPSRSTIGAAAQRGAAARKTRTAHPAGSAAPALRVVPDPPEPTPATATSATSSGMTSASDFEGVVSLIVEGLRKAGSLVGIEGDDLEQRIAQALAFLRRRMTGDYEIDDFGFDREFTDQVWLPILRPLYKRWFRVEVRGIENIPDEGAALVVANHSGTLPIDGLMTQVAIHDEHPKHRHVRMLGADLVFESPLVGELSRKSGTTLASNPDIERLFAAGELAAVYPEGFKGVGKPFSERYKLQRFGRGGFVSAALRAEVPIIPCAIVGAEEIFPMIGNLKGLARVLGFPYFPVTPFFPLLGLAGLIPLPSKWIIEFGAPVDTDSYGAAAADDPMLVFDLTDQVRENIQQSLYSLLLQRRSVFF
ncbi:1-acyl-sn-glycerol-3-phosphate acyltransferase [Flexivirga sp. B27]